jgi:hypothetical protein
MTDQDVVTYHQQELEDSAVDWLQTNVLRLVATKVVPLIMASGLVTGAIAWLQDAVGIDLPAAAVATFIGSVMAGVVVVAFAYVKNHGGAAYLGRTLLELKTLQARGALAEQQGVTPGLPSGEPVVPPGLMPEDKARGTQ